MAIFLGFTIAGICWSIHPRSSIIFQLLPILIIPFIIGLLDDLIQLKPTAKLIAQWMTASLLFFVTDIRLTSDYGLFGGINFSAPFSYAFTLVIVILITNSLNLIDGIDGLAATFSFIACIFFGGWFFFNRKSSIHHSLFRPRRWNPRLPLSKLGTIKYFHGRHGFPGNRNNAFGNDDPIH